MSRGERSTRRSSPPPRVPISRVRRVGERAVAVESAEEVELSAAPTEEVAGAHPGGWPRAEDFLPPADDARAFLSGARRWLAVAGLALVVALLTAAWSVVQLTNRGHAERVIGEALVPLTEVDRLVARDYAGLVAEAASGGRTAVIVEGYSLGLAVPAAELATMTRAELRARLLSDSAARIYEDGVGIFQREDGSGGGRFSARGIYQLTAGQLTAQNHTIAIIMTALLLLFLVPMLVLTTSAGNGATRVRNLGLALALAGGGLTVAGLAAWFGLGRAADGADDVFNETLLDLAADLAWLPLRNGVTVAVLGLLIVAGSFGLPLYRRRLRRKGARGAHVGGESAERGPQRERPRQ